MRRVPARVAFDLRDRDCALGIFHDLPPSLKGYLLERESGHWQMLIEISEPETYTLAQLLECVAECGQEGDVGPAHIVIDGREYLLDPGALAGARAAAETERTERR